MAQHQWLQDRLFEPPPRAISQIKVRCDVNIDGPAGTSVVWVTIEDLTTGEQLACWSNPPNQVWVAPECASEIMADAVRTAMRDLSPF